MVSYRPGPEATQNTGGAARLPPGSIPPEPGAWAKDKRVPASQFANFACSEFDVGDWYGSLPLVAATTPASNLKMSGYRRNYKPNNPKPGFLELCILRQVQTVQTGQGGKGPRPSPNIYPHSKLGIVCSQGKLARATTGLDNEIRPPITKSSSKSWPKMHDRT